MGKSINTEDSELSIGWRITEWVFLLAAIVLFILCILVTKEWITIEYWFFKGSILGPLAFVCLIVFGLIESHDPKPYVSTSDQRHDDWI